MAQMGFSPPVVGVHSTFGIVDGGRKPTVSSAKPASTALERMLAATGRAKHCPDAAFGVSLFRYAILPCYPLMMTRSYTELGMQRLLRRQAIGMGDRAHPAQVHFDAVSDEEDARSYSIGSRDSTPSSDSIGSMDLDELLSSSDSESEEEVIDVVAGPIRAIAVRPVPFHTIPTGARLTLPNGEQYRLVFIFNA